MRGQSFSALPLLILLTAATPMQSPGNIGQLGDAVASVNDWRAILLFVIFVMLAQMVNGAWQRFQDRKAIERLAASNDRLASAISAHTTASLLHQARVESFLARIEK